jgi:uncharacterized membrane-anchored protein
MKKRLIIILFLLSAASQMFLSVSSVISRENVLSNGTVHKFRTVPVDPYDPFRGKYVALDIENSLRIADSKRYSKGEKVFVTITRDSEGYSSFSEVVDMQLVGDDFIRMKIDYIYDDEIRFEIPFDRYYIDEDYAEEAEKEYWKADEDNFAYIEVRIRNGHAVLDELYLNGIPVIDYLKL